MIGLDNRILLFDKTKGIGLSRLKPGEIHRLRELPELTTLFAHWGVMDVRGLGFTPVGLWNTNRLKNRVQMIGNIDRIKTITNVGENRYRVLSEEVNGSAVPWRAYVDWDLQQNVPLEYKYYVSNKDGVPPTKTGTAEWKSIDGNILPVSSRLSNRDIKKVEGNRFMTRTDVAIDVHWFSFNQDLPDELFEEGILSDRKKLDELLSQEVFESPDKARSPEPKK